MSPVSRRLDAPRFKAPERGVDVVDIRLCKQHLARPLGLLVIAFTDAMMPDVALPVD